MRRETKKELRKHSKCLYNGTVVSYRVCDHSYHCKTCGFYQMVMDYEVGDLTADHNEKLCIYNGTEVSYRVCDNAFNCATCAFNQLVQDATEAVPFYKKV